MKDYLFIEKSSDIITCIHLNLNYLENEFETLNDSKHFSDIKQDMEELVLLLRKAQRQITV